MESAFFLITSYGGLIEGLSEEEFFACCSKPRNRELMRIFKDVGLVEQLGSGMARILSAYDKSIFELSKNFTKVTFKFSEKVAIKKDVIIMDDTIYYSKFEFQAYHLIYYRIICNISAGELSYQEFDYRENLTFSCGIKLSKDDINKLLPYIKAKEFEVYRNKPLSMDDPGFCGYRDEYSLKFTGITNSNIPILKIYMDYLYTEKYNPPFNRLYDYVCQTYLTHKILKKIKPKFGKYSGECPYL